ncbi:MAG TPA: chromosomal replication initiator protein DnaA [Candidatus Polarisedimenticolia bacterium]|nr:chromosomal replication initiator protein DnaA [Candidatus Polarisedimenticolia bacterium]
MNLWDRVLQRVEPKLNSQSFDTWLKPTQQISMVDGTLEVEVPSAFFADWITNNYLPILRESLGEVHMGELAIRFRARLASAPAQEAPTERFLRRQLAPLPPTSGPAALHPRYTFETFVASSSNQLAHAAANAVAEQLPTAYNPLYIYGGVGLGKTHLMHAIGNHLRGARPELRQRYVSTENFMNELINAIRFEKTLDFKEKYRSADLLLVDDVQFLAGKERTQEEFFHTFNALYEAQKQIVITSDCPPRQIPTLEERLRSRFEWDLITDIQPPDLETKIAILRKKAEAERVDLPQDVALFISSKIKSNIRELEGSLIRLIAFSSLTRRPIDLDLARETLKDLLEAKSRSVTTDSIQRLVSNYFKIKISDLKTRNNSRSISFPRQVAMYLCKTMTDQSLPAIGDNFGGKHHSTVIHAIRKVEGRRKSDKDFDRLVQSFIESLE